MAKLCDACKRQGRVWCPHNAALEIRARIAPTLKKEMFGPTPPHVFVGHNFYPNVYWGPLVSSEAISDDPRDMYGMSLEKIIESRAGMVRGMKKDSVKASGRMLSEAQSAVMSIKPVDVEARFSRDPVFSLELDDVAHPMGASAPIERFKVADNVSVPKKVDSMANDNVLANEAIVELLLSGFDVHYLSKLLTAGVLGKGENKKMVPTKWAITATDDMAAKHMMGSVRDNREIAEPCVYSNTYLDNHFEILLLPGSWEYEQFEAALTPELEERGKKRQGASGAKQGRDTYAEGMKFEHAAWEKWKTDGTVNFSEEHEPFFGRSDYAKRQGGGYYAARFSVVEALYNMRRQARVVVFREIGTAYTVPVGVWEVRENVRHAFENGPVKFSTREAALSHIASQLSMPLGEYMKKSKVLLQRRLTEF
jgi:DNA repair protein NreA